MTSERRYTRIPPESTGDRVQMNVTIDVPYINKADVWLTGSLVVGATSGFSGRIARLREDTATTGVVSLRPEIDPEDNNIFPTVGENLQLGGVTIAQVGPGAQTEIFTPAMKIVGWRGSYSGLDVDKRGNANVRFQEGNPSLDAYGKLRISQARPVGDYVFGQDLLPRFISQATIGSGTVTWSSTARAAILSTTTANNDHSQMTTDQYHHTIPGESTFVNISVSCGDTGKANLVRRWGYFDDSNGFFFQQAGPDNISLVLRSSLSGAPIDTVIPQSQWSNDVAVGTGGELNITGMHLDTSLTNVYWIDMQDGDGRIRFGCFYEGEKITFHEEFTSNSRSDLIIQTTRLPLRVEQLNTGVTGSSSEIKWYSGAVYYETNLVTKELGYPTTFEHSGTTVGSTETFIGTARFAPTVANGATNHNSYFPERIAIQSIDSVALAPGWVKMRVYAGGAQVGGTWDQIPGTNYQTNTTGAIGTPGALIAVYYVNGIEKIELTNIYNNSNNSALRNKADGTPLEFYFTIERQIGANDVDVSFTYIIKEIAI
jgi:hypothetical protein